MLGKKRQFYNNSLARSTFKTKKTSKWSTAPRGQMGGNVPYSIQQVTNFGYITATSAERGGFVATSNPSLNWYGLKIAIPPTRVS